MQSGESEKKGRGSSSDETGQSSGKKGATTSKKGKLYMPEQIRKIESDAATPVGREKKVVEGERDEAKRQVELLTKRLEGLEAADREARLADAREDPKELRLFQREETVTKRERAVEAKELDVSGREVALKTEREAVDGDKRKVDLAYLSAKYGVPEDELEDLDIKDPDALEKVAAKLSTSKTEGKKPGEGEGEGEGTGGEEFAPDEGEGAGELDALGALNQANEDFADGKITEKQLQEIAAKVK